MVNIRESVRDVNRALESMPHSGIASFSGSRSARTVSMMERRSSTRVAICARRSDPATLRVALFIAFRHLDEWAMFFRQSSPY
jgi:hypothetical protein